MMPSVLDELLILTIVCMSLQNDLDEIYQWSKYWKLNFTSLKCKVIYFTRNRNPIMFVYKINGEPLENVSSFCDLGITVDRFLTHNVHIKNVINKCNKSKRHDKARSWL